MGALRAGSMHPLILVAILLVAAYVRLTHLDLGWFMLDQARDSGQALGIAGGRAFPLTGPEVDGGPSHTWGPLYFMLLAIPFTFSSEPALAATFLGLLGLMAVWLTYRLGATFFGREVGLVGAALFAAHPGSVTSARALWNVAPLPLFTIIFFYGLFAVVVHRRSPMIVLPVAALACLVQFHLATLALAPVLVLALLVYRPPIGLRHLGWAAGVGAVLMLPFLIGQILSRLDELRAMLTYARGQAGVRPAGELLGLVLQAFFASAHLSTRVAGQLGSPTFLHAFAIVQRVEAWIVLVSAVAAVGRLAAAWPRGESLRSTALARYGVLALWIWFPLLVLGLKRGRLPWYYFDILYPAPFIAAAIVLATLGTMAAFVGPASARLVRGAVALFVALLVLVQADFTRRWWTVTAASGKIPVVIGIGLDEVREAPMGRLMPIRYKRDIVAALVERTGPDASALYHRAHGVLFEDLLEDKGFFFRWFWGSGSGRAGASTLAPARHYTLVQTSDRDRTTGPRPVARVGPYGLLEFTPLVDYQSWQYSDDAVPARWTVLALPTRGIPDLAIHGYPPLLTWRQLPVFVRGDIVVSTPPPSFRLIVVLREPYDGSQHRIEGLAVNGTSVPPVTVRSHPTFIARDAETVFELGDRLRAGRNRVTFRISGEGRTFDLDVYELRG